MSGSRQHLFLNFFCCFSVENLDPHGSHAIFKLINVSYAPPNCPDPLVKGKMILWR